MHMHISYSKLSSIRLSIKKGERMSHLFFALFTLLFAFYLSFFNQFKVKKSTNPLPPAPPKLPILGHLPTLGRLPYRTLHKWALKYGPIMRLHIGLVPTIVVSSPEVAELFLKQHDLNFSNRPKTLVSESTELGSKGMLFSEYGTFLRDIRKLCSVHLLSVSKVESFMFLRREEIKDFIGNMRETSKGSRKSLNISDEVSLLIEKITCRMLFGTANKERERFNFKPLVEEGLRLIGTFNVNDYLPFMKAFDFQGLTKRSKHVTKLLDAHLDRIIDECENEVQSHQDHHKDFVNVVMSLLNSYYVNGQVPNRSDIKVVILDLIGGTWETSATSIEWVLKELVKHPQVLKRVQEELANVVGMDRMVEESDIVSLPYLDMVVKESMRLHPFVPLIPRESAEAVTINGLHIPKKSRIIVNVWALGRDRTVWSDNVEEFYPERFAKKDIDLRGHNFGLLPFGSGRRQCPGLELGTKTVKIVLAQLLHCFKLELPDGMSPGDVDMKEIFGGKANPLYVVPTYRLRN